MDKPIIAIGCMAAVAALAFAPTAAQAQDRVSRSEAVASLNRAAPEVLARSASTFPAKVARPSVLADAGGYRATGIDGTGRIARAARDGFSLSNGADTVAIRPLGVTRGASAAKVVNGDALVYANTGTAADTVVRPTAAGIETYTQVRSESASEYYTWAVTLAPGQQLRLTKDGGAGVFDADGTWRVAVSPPVAKDANGTPVPVAFGVYRNLLVLRAAHRGRGFAYPVVIDPHWGWVHKVKIMNVTQTRRYIRLMRSGRDAAAIVGALFAVVSGGASTVIANALLVVGFGRHAEDVGDALDRSRRRGVRIDYGLRCRNIKFFPDPCWPAIWVRPR